jgi:hypothetical protein
LRTLPDMTSSAPMPAADTLSLKASTGAGGYITGPYTEAMDGRRRVAIQVEEFDESKG